MTNISNKPRTIRRTAGFSALFSLLPLSRPRLRADGLANLNMQVARPSSALGEWFDPMSVLVEDAVSFEPPEKLVYDFIDRLMANQASSSERTLASLSGEHEGFSNRHKRIKRMHVRSPVSTLDYNSDVDVPMFKQGSPSFSDSGDSRGSPGSPQRTHGSVGLSRKNRPQRCSICKECGHKSRTCRFAPGNKADLRPGSPPAFGSIALQTASF